MKFLAVVIAVSAWGVPPNPITYAIDNSGGIQKQLLDSVTGVPL
jgi:hypothetical protein